eukprot:756824-Prymnesium_polylepis.2
MPGVARQAAEGRAEDRRVRGGVHRMSGSRYQPVSRNTQRSAVMPIAVRTVQISEEVKLRFIKVRAPELAARPAVPLQLYATAGR